MKINWLAVFLGMGVFFPATFLARSLEALVVGDGELAALPVAMLVGGVAAGFAAGALAGRAGLLYGVLAGSPWTLAAGLTALITWALSGQAPSPTPDFWALLVLGPVGGGMGGWLGVRIGGGRVILKDVLPPGRTWKWSPWQLLLLFGAMALTYIVIAYFGFRPVGLGVGLLSVGYGAYQGWRLRGRAETAQILGSAFFVLMGAALVLAAWLWEPSGPPAGPPLWGALLGVATGGLLAGFLLWRYSEKRSR